MLWKVVMSRMCDALSTCQTEDYLLTQQLQWYSYEGNVRSIHICATLQFTLGPKLKPASFLQAPQTWRKLMAMFGLDSSPVSFSIALTFSSPSCLQQAAHCPPLAFGYWWPHQYSRMIFPSLTAGHLWVHLSVVPHNCSVTIVAEIVMKTHIGWILQACTVLKCSSSYLINMTCLYRTISDHILQISELKSREVISYTIGNNILKTLMVEWKWFKLRLSDSYAQHMLSYAGLSKILQVIGKVGTEEDWLKDMKVFWAIKLCHRDKLSIDKAMHTQVIHPGRLGEIK